MKTHNQRMDVIGNNISNVNTTGYKTSEVTFKDIYYQTKAQASSGNATQGGTNPTQIGYGAQLGTISQVMSQSGFTYSDSVYNCALEGEGFFQVMDEAGNIFYTRAGKFSVDSYGNLCDPSGNMVLGVSGDPTGIETGQSQRINLRIPAVDDNRASCTKTVNGYDITISASDPGEQGNISFTIVDSDTPFATKSGTNLTIYMDLSQEFGSEALGTYYETVMTTLGADNTFTGTKIGQTVDGTGATVDVTIADKLAELLDKYGDDDGSGNKTPNDAYYKAAYEALESQIDKYVGSTSSGISAANADTIAKAKNTYTESALAEFQKALNDAIDQGGVGLPDGVKPLSVEFGTLPPYSDVRALNAKNTLPLSATVERQQTDADGNPLTDATTGEPLMETVDVKSGITFTANQAGEFANKYEIDIKYQANTPVTAKWKDNTLTLILPDTGVTLAQINDAIHAAADGNDNKEITASMGTYYDADGTEHTYDESTLNDFHFSTFKTNIERLGLDGGRDNFFSDIATAMSTVTLTDGRVASEQAVDDLETVMIDKNGIIYGRHAVHGLLLLGRIDIATFENPVGLEQVGTTLWRASLASGEAQVKIAGTDGAGEVVAGALEMSNVDLAQEFSDMIITQRGYQANSRVITVSDTMLEELVNLKR